jgi:dephospho-CoA kinase
MKNSGIASGKSSVTKILQDKMDLIIIDADKIGHNAYEKQTPCFYKLIEAFGDMIVDEQSGEIDRRKLGGIAFSNKDKMVELTSIVWPEIRRLLIDELEKIKSTAKAGDMPMVALEAAVMCEAGWYDLVSVLWVIQVDRDTARDRLMARNSLSSEEAMKRIDSQMSNEERSKFATHVLDNNLSVEQLESETRRLFDLSVTP